MGPTPPIHAVIVGINKYPQPFDHLTSAVGDARKMKKLLMDRLGAQEENISLLEDTDATKDNIIDAITSLRGNTKRERGGAITSPKPNAERDDAIIFFFSGYAGSTGKPEQGGGGSICPVDVSDEGVGGISDRALLQILDQLSKSYGNNITVFLDCSAKNFSWNNPTSCVVVAPNNANETEEGGAFTQAIDQVLRDPEQPLESMTVQCFSGHLQAAMDDVEVLCVGSNINRPLFNWKADRGSHALIAGRTLKGGTILLCAGAAHGVRPNAVYGIYRSNLKAHMKKLGELYVHALNDDDVTAELRSSKENASLKVPPFFYAAEIRGYFDPLKIFVPEIPVILNDVFDWEDEREPESKSNITLLQDAEGTVSFQWNGLTGDRWQKRKTSDASFTSSVEVDPAAQRRIQREIRRAARFHSILTATSPRNSSISKGLQIRFQKTSIDTDLPTGSNLLKDECFDLPKRDPIQPEMGEYEAPCFYCLTIINNNPFPVWPYVFYCDPDGFCISPWYLPPPGALEPPLNSELLIGCDNKKTRLALSRHEDRDCDFIYLKVFVTRQRADFTFITQWYISPMEDKVREYEMKKNSASSETVQKSKSTDDDDDELQHAPGDRILVSVSNWASTRITIFNDYNSATTAASES